MAALAYGCFGLWLFRLMAALVYGCFGLWLFWLMATVTAAFSQKLASLLSVQIQPLGLVL